MILVKHQGQIISAERVTVSTMPEYRAWAQMKARCYKRRHKNYKNYGLRGIRVCDAWRRSFVQFYLDVGPRSSPQYSIHRIDNDEHYTPENCKWALRHEQHANMQKTRWVEYQGERVRLFELARQNNMTISMLAGRIANGWPIDVAVTWPKGKHYKIGEKRKPTVLRDATTHEPLNAEEAAKRRVQTHAANKKHLRRARRGLT